MRRIFFDANVIIAGSVLRTGASRALLLLAEAGMFQMVVSQLVLDETERNLRLKFPGGLPIMVDLLANTRLEIVPDPVDERFELWLHVIEYNDAPILQAALDADVTHLISLNTHHFTSRVAQETGLIIMEPKQLVIRLRELITKGLL